jgi:hypothetical protein
VITQAPGQILLDEFGYSYGPAVDSTAVRGQYPGEDLQEEDFDKFPEFKILAARYAAFAPLSIPTQATGTPFGI